MLVDLLMYARVCMDALDMVAETQKVMQQMVVANTFFQKRDSRLVAYQLGI